MPLVISRTPSIPKPQSLIKNFLSGFFWERKYDNDFAPYGLTALWLISN